MRPFSVAVCDEDTQVLNYQESYIQQVFSNRNIVCQVRAFSDPKELYALLDTQGFDIVFLDIDMPEINGFDLAQKSMQTYPQMLIIFVTGHDELVFPTFRYHPFRFIRKRYFEKEITEAVDAAIQSISERNRILEITGADSIRYVYLSEILYIESQHNYLNIVTRHGEIRCRDTMQHKEKELGGMGFIRVHSGYLVNQRYIHSIDLEWVYLRSKEYPKVPLSRRRREQVIRGFQQYMRN